jgi:hypothetical protein
MVLQTGDTVYIAHFSHSVIARKTDCGVHEGRCPRTNGKESCKAEVVWRGRARASLLDQFTRATGRKIAFTRAIAHLPKELRSKLWNAYWNEVRGVR